MAKTPSPAPSRSDDNPRPDGYSDALTGEIVEHVEAGMINVAGRNMPDLDQSMAVALSDVEIDRQIKTARQYPRSIQVAINQTKTLVTLDMETAAECQYALPRGKENGRQKFILGPSIRFAETLAQQWGNNRVASRVTDIDRKNKLIEAEGIYHDLETNFAVARRIQRRISDSKGRLYNDDMIMVTGNAASQIALRNAILQGIPKPVWRQPYLAVQAAIAGDLATISQRRVALLARFNADLNIAPDLVFRILGVKGEEDIRLDEIVAAQGFYSGLRGGDFTVEDLLAQAAPNVTPGKGLSGAFAGSAGAKPADPPKSPPAPRKATPDPDPEPEEQIEADAGTPAADPDPDPDPVVEDARENSDAADAGQPDATADDEETAALDAEVAAFLEFAAESTSWLTVKARWRTFRAQTYDRLPSDRQGTLMRVLAGEVKRLRAAGDPVTPADDLTYFMIWLHSAQPDEVEDTWQDVVATKAYRDLPESTRDSIADSVNAALGDRP